MRTRRPDEPLHPRHRRPLPLPARPRGDSVPHCPLGAGALAVTVLTVEEQIAGRFAQLRKARQPDQTARAYQALADTVHHLSRLPILSFTRPAIARYDGLMALKLQIGKMDLRIAAVTLENNAVLVTRNLRDFQRVPNLAVENWAV